LVGKKVRITAGENVLAYRSRISDSSQLHARTGFHIIAMKCDENSSCATKKAPTSFEDGALSFNPAASYSSIEQLYSTIGAGGLNGRVRDGIGCDTSAIATGNWYKMVYSSKVQQFNVGTGVENLERANF
jgi:hypothetical protein